MWQHGFNVKFSLSFSASNTHSIGDKIIERKNGKNYSQCSRPLHGGGEAHLCLAPVEGHDLQVDEQVVDKGHARASAGPHA
jgi:hypothetical protein